MDVGSRIRRRVRHPLWLACGAAPDPDVSKGPVPLAVAVLAGRPPAARVAAGGGRRSLLPPDRRVPRLGHAGRRQDDVRPPRRAPDARPRAASRASPSSPRRRTSRASGPPTPPATASTSSRTGRTPPGPSRATATASPSRIRPSPPARPSTAAAAPRVPTLLIADEPHHMGDDAAWGRSATDAFGAARFKLLLSGTPFRTDDTPIPWVSYDADGVSEPDYAYGYTDALLDHVCRPVTFHLNDGDMEWMSDGRRRSADFTRRPARRRGRAPAAHRARPRRRLDRARAARRGPAAGADPRRRPPGRRRAGRRRRQGARRGARRAARARGRRAAGGRHERRARRVGADRPLRRRAAAAGSSPC